MGSASIITSIIVLLLLLLTSHSHTPRLTTPVEWWSKEVCTQPFSSPFGHFVTNGSSSLRERRRRFLHRKRSTKHEQRILPDRSVIRGLKNDSPRARSLWTPRSWNRETPLAWLPPAPLFVSEKLEPRRRVFSKAKPPFVGSSLQRQ